MPKVQETTEFTRELIPAGSYFVRLVQIIDLWTQAIVWNEEEKQQRKIMFTFELPDEKYEFETKDGEKKSGVKLKSKQYTLSWSEQAWLRKMIETRQGNQTLGSDWLDVSVWLGKCGIGTIQHNVAKNGKTYDNLEAITPLMKWMEDQKQITPSLYFDLDDFNPVTFDSLPEWIQNIIRLSPEYDAVAWNKPTETVADSKPIHWSIEDTNDLPF